MNILFLCPFYFPHIGGVETHTAEVAKRLKKKGHKITIVTEHQIKYPKIKLIGLLFIWFWFLQNLKLITKADLIHAHDVFIWYLPFRFIFLKKPVFTTFHGYETKFPPSKKAIFLRKIAEKLSWGNICVGNYIKKWYGTKPDYVTYGGVNKNQKSKIKNQKYLSILCSRPKGNSKLKILFIGRLEEDTGINTYLETLEILKKKGINYEFKACGDGSLRKQVEKYGRVYGFVRNLKPYLARSDLVFSSSYLSILQALINRKLVFASFNNPLKEDYLRMAPFAKWIIIEDNAEKLASKIFFLSVDQAYLWAKEQTWDSVADIYESLYSHNSVK